MAAGLAWLLGSHVQHATQRVPFVEPAVNFSIDHTCHAWLQPCCPPVSSALCSSLENLPTFYALLLTAGVSARRDGE